MKLCAVALVLVALGAVQVSAQFKFDKMGGGRGDKGLLKGLDAETRKKAMSIFKNKDLTKRQIEQQLADLASTLNPDQQEKFSQMKQKHEARIQEMQAKIATLVPTLSPEAQQIVRAVQSIFENKDITFGQQQEQLKELKQNAPESTKKELKSVFKSLRGKGARGGKGGMRRNNNSDKMEAPPMEPFNQEDFDVAGVVVGF